jgi:hypothetical protein
MMSRRDLVAVLLIVGCGVVALFATGGRVSPGG